MSGAEERNGETEDTSEKYVALETTMDALRRDDADWEPEAAGRRTFYFRVLPQNVPLFATWPAFESDRETVQAFTARFLDQREGYSWTLDFSADLFCELSYDGFLCTSLELRVGQGAPLQVMLPWNEKERNTLDWSELHVSKHARKRAKRYSITVDAAYDEVMLQCIRMHGEGWLYRGLRWLLRRLFRLGYQGKRGIKVGVHSFELWDQDGRLVAGDLGYTVGGVYTSMTGFRLQDTQGAGEVQLVLTAALLEKMGYSWWDLGMAMKYKARLGARIVARDAFMQRLRADRDRPVAFAHERIGGGELMAWLLDASRARGAAEASVPTAMVL